MPFTVATPALFFSACFLFQLISLVTFYVSHNASYSQRGSVAKIARTLPLSKTTSWFLLLMPGFLHLFLTMTLVWLPLQSLLKQLSLSLPYIAVATAVGIFSAAGLFYGLAVQKFVVKMGILIATIGAEYKCLGMIHGHSSVSWIGFYSLALLLVSGVALFIVSRSYACNDELRSRQRPAVRTSTLPVCFWFFKKIYRTSPTAQGWLVAFILSGVIAYVMERLTMVDVGMACAVTSIIIASFMSDIRRLSRRLCPIEILGLRGCFRFTIAQAIGGFIAAIGTVIPLLYILLHHAQAIDSLVIMASGYIMAGFGAGLLASTIIVPTAQDISAQFSATLLAVCMLVIPLLPFGVSLSEPVRYVSMNIIGLLFVIGSMAVEYKRNKYIWRIHE
jgi:hypothetical protein